MCIAIPMRIKEVLDESRAIGVRPGRTEELDTSFAQNPVAAGDLVLVFKGTVLRTVSQTEALQVEEALKCVEAAMRTDEAVGVDEAFADIIENSGKLPEHLQKLVGRPPAAESL